MDLHLDLDSDGRVVGEAVAEEVERIEHPIRRGRNVEGLPASEIEVNMVESSAVPDLARARHARGREGAPRPEDEEDEEA